MASSGEPPKRLRIALVVHDYHRGGGHARYTVELATRFRKDHDVHVFATQIDKADSDGITFHWIPSLRLTSLTSILSFILPATLMVRGPFDIVHAQGLCGLRQNVMTVHMCQAAWFNAVDQYQLRWQGPPPWRKRLFRAITTRLDKLTLSPAYAARFIAPSKLVQENLLQYHGLKEQVRVVYHGTDIETFHPRNRDTFRKQVRQELGLQDDELVALYVGDAQKGCPAACRALAFVPGVKLMVVSRSPDDIARMASEAGVANRVIAAPFSRQVERYYAAADVLLYPSFYDTFGLVITEAMASGLPVVTCHTAGASELIEHQHNGWLTSDPSEPAEIAAGLRALAADPALRERMGQAARESVERYTWDKSAAETMAIYQEVVAQRSGSAPKVT